MVTRTAATIWLALACVNLSAGIVVIDTSDAKAGDYLVLVTVKADGTSTSKLLDNVIRLTGQDDEDNGDREETLLESIARRGVARVVDKNKEENAQKLAIVYKTLADNANDFKSMDDLQEATGRAAKAVLGRSFAAWQRDWIGPIQKQLEQLEKDGHITSVASAATAFRQIASGLERATPAKAINPDNLRIIIELIMAIIRLFTGQGG